MGLLDGKVALITGGSRGIGKCIALKFAAEGADIIYTDRHHDDSVAREVAALGRRVMEITSDAADFEAAHETVQKVVKEFGRIDILVNNAGIVDDSLMLRMREEQWDEVIRVNIKSVFNYTHAVTPVMSRQRSGSIVNLSSVVGVSGNPGQCNYAASKAGIIGLTKSFAKEMGIRGIRANCVAPGFITSEMTSTMPADLHDYWIRNISMRREGTMDEVAGVVLFLASDLSSYVTGQVINCCGGLVC